jgi:hypothetical protein
MVSAFVCVIEQSLHSTLFSFVHPEKLRDVIPTFPKHLKSDNVDAEFVISKVLILQSFTIRIVNAEQRFRPVICVNRGLTAQEKSDNVDTNGDTSSDDRLQASHRRF